MVPFSYISVHSVMSVMVVGLLALAHKTILYGSSGVPSEVGLYEAMSEALSVHSLSGNSEISAGELRLVAVLKEAK